MTTIAAGASATITVAPGGQVAVASNGGSWVSVETPVVGPVRTSNHGPTAHTRVFGPYAQGATLVITNQSVNAFNYVDYEVGATTLGTIAVGASTTFTLTPQGTLSVSNPSGYWQVSVTPAIGNVSTAVYGPGMGNMVFGPYQAGATVVVTNQTGAALVTSMVTAQYAFITGIIGGTNVLTANVSASVTATSWQWKRDGSNIGGATTSTYTQVPATDSGTTIGVSINGGAFTASVSIPAIPPVFSAAPTITAATTTGVTFTAATLSNNGTPTSTVTHDLYDNGALVASNYVSGGTFVVGHTMTLIPYAVQGGVRVVQGAASAGSVVSAVQPLRAVNPYNQFADQASTTAGTRFSFAYRMPVYIGSGDVSELVVALSNAFQNISSVDLGANGYSIDGAALERVSVASTTPIKWGASRTLAVSAGSAKILSDPILPSVFGLAKFTRGELYWLRFKISLTGVGQSFASVSSPGPNSTIAGGQQALVYDGAAGTLSSVDATGSFNAATGTPGQGGAGAYLPVITLGRFITGDPCTLDFLGDSIFRGQFDTVLAGSPARSCFDADFISNPVGCIKFARQGGFSLTWQSANAGRMLEYLQYGKYGWEEYGTNGLSQTDERPLWALIRANGPQIIVRNTILPRTSSTDSWATVANQTVAADQDGFNTFLQTQLGIAGGVDAIMDAHSAVCDSTVTSKWAANGTASFGTPDGIHPQAVNYENIAALMRAYRAANLP